MVCIGNILGNFIKTIGITTADTIFTSIDGPLLQCRKLFTKGKAIGIAPKDLKAAI